MSKEKFLLEPVAHQAAIDFIASKPAVSREVFERLLPELRARAITVSRVEGLNVVQRIRDRIADLPAGGDWDAIKADVVADLLPGYVDPDAEPEARDAQINAANRHAETLIRTHGFQAYQAAAYQSMERMKDVFPNWQYMTMQDDRVRDEHEALDGLILPADSPFWVDHYPPWDWGCRCMVRVVTDDEVADAEAGSAEYGWTLDETQRKHLEETMQLPIAETGQVIDVSSPRASGQENAFGWNPADLSIPMAELEKRYDPDIWEDFKKALAEVSIDRHGVETTKKNEYRSLYELLSGNRAMTPKAADEFTAKSAIKTPVLHQTDLFAKRAIEQSGFRVMPAPVHGRMYGDGVYFTLSGSPVKSFGKEKVHAVLNVRNPLRATHFDLIGRQSPLRQKMEKEFPDVKNSGERIALYASKHGFDAVIIERKDGMFVFVPDLRNIGILP